MRLATAVVVAIAALAATLGAQDLPRFEVASIKPRAELTFEELRTVMMRPIRVEPGGRFVVTGATLRNLITFAFGVRMYQQPIRGGAAILDDTFEVTARGPADLTMPASTMAGYAMAPVNLMLQRLLAERFNLVVRWEPQERRTYHLVTSRPARALGPGIRPWTSDCSLENMPTDGRRRCGPSTINGKFIATGQSMADLADYLSLLLGTAVTDGTGLDGRYDLDGAFATRELMQQSMSTIFGRGVGSPLTPVVEDLPTVFEALPEQFGLRLEPQRGPVPFLVVERVETLVEN
jgi:uncharacterized protein (TIGR03435 family)